MSRTTAPAQRLSGRRVSMAASLAAVIALTLLPATAQAETFGGTKVDTGTPVDTTAVQIKPAPAPVDPAPVDPAPVDPAPVDPAPVDPAPVDPAPVDPAPVDPAPGASDLSTRDGSTSDRALASCWDIKQTNPAAVDGLYWVYTPALTAPTRVYCDMTTDGGGWVLIGRGREGWSFLDEGQGSTSEVSAVIDGPAAFAPKLLTGPVVRGLLNNGAVDQLSDGLRIRRAAAQDGTSWQEVRVRPSRFPSWRWVLNGPYPVSSVSFDGVSYAVKYSTQRIPVDTATRFITTTKQKQNTFLPGFAYGVGVIGDPAPTSYLWSPTSAGNAIPFAQLYLRPMLRFSDFSFPSVAAGFGAQTVAPLANNLAQPQLAGVSGLANGFTTERDTEVRAITQIGDTMYVGGNFAKVDNYADATSSPQAYLAAFDARTGAAKPGFAPVLDGKVNALVALPGGLLGVGGEFTTVNGQARAGLVALDAATGATASTFTTAVEYRSNGVTSPGTVTGLSVVGNTLYAGGSFTHIAGGGTSFAYTKRAARLDATTGRPDATWNPAFNGTPIFVLASTAGDRVYFGGFMTTMNDEATPAKYFAAVTTSSPALPVSGLTGAQFSATSTTYQQTATEVGDKFWLGGSEHAFFMYDRATITLQRGNITASDTGSGGDFQSSTVNSGIIYGSCHCILSNNLGGGQRWPTSPTFDNVDSLRYIGAYDAATGQNLPAFLPQMRTRAIRGPWAMTTDTQGCLWAGGDTTETKSTSGLWQRSGGFARHCRVDTTAPNPASGLKVVTNADNTVTVSWTGPENGLTYRLYRGDIVVWSGTSWKVTLPAMPGAAYAVDAIDKAGNVSATTAQVIAP